jgi:hypothetical protein
MEPDRFLEDGVELWEYRLDEPPLSDDEIEDLMEGAPDGF